MPGMHTLNLVCNTPIKAHKGICVLLLLWLLTSAADLQHAGAWWSGDCERRHVQGQQWQLGLHVPPGGCQDTLITCAAAQHRAAQVGASKLKQETNAWVGCLMGGHEAAKLQLYVTFLDALLRADPQTHICQQHWSGALTNGLMFCGQASVTRGLARRSTDAVKERIRLLLPAVLGW